MTEQALANPRPKSSRPLSSRPISSRPKSGKPSALVENEISGIAIEENIDESIPRPDVIAPLEVAMNLLKQHELTGINIHNMHEDLNAPIESENPDVPAVLPFDNPGAELVFEKLAIRVNELEDCIKIQEAVNEGLANALKDKGFETKAAIATVNSNVHEISIQMDTLSNDMRYIGQNMKSMEKMQRKMDISISELQKTVIALQTRPLSTRSNQGIATPIARPKSSYIRVESAKAEVKNESEQTAADAAEDMKDLDSVDAAEAEDRAPPPGDSSIRAIPAMPPARMPAALPGPASPWA